MENTYEEVVLQTVMKDILQGQCRGPRGRAAAELGGAAGCVVSVRTHCWRMEEVGAQRLPGGSAKLQRGESGHGLQWAHCSWHGPGGSVASPCLSYIEGSTFRGVLGERWGVLGERWELGSHRLLPTLRPQRSLVAVPTQAGGL